MVTGWISESWPLEGFLRHGLRIFKSSQLSKLGIKHSFKDNKFIGIFCYDLVSKEIIENSFNVKKEINGNIELKLFRTESPCQS